MCPNFDANRILSPSILDKVLHFALVRGEFQVLRNERSIVVSILISIGYESKLLTVFDLMPSGLDSLVGLGKRAGRLFMGFFQGWIGRVFGFRFGVWWGCCGVLVSRMQVVVWSFWIGAENFF